MPLYEYACKKCGNRFEELVRGGEEPHCPACQSRSLERLLSVFAVNGGRDPAPRGGPGPCGTCGDPRGPGSCAMG